MNNPNQEKDITEEQKSKLEELQQLLSKMQQKPKLKKWQECYIKIVNFVLHKLTTVVHYIDRFINFIVKTTDPARNEIVQVSRGPILFGTYVIIIFFGIGGLWASLAPLDSAAVATGTVIANSKKKIVSHQEGGIIKSVFVKQGDIVKKGQPLIALDDIRPKSNFEATLNQYRVVLATEDRLLAERDNLEKIEFDPFLLESKDIDEVTKMLRTQENLFKSRQESFKSAIENGHQKIEQYKKQIEGYEARQAGDKKNLSIIQERLKSTSNLLAKGFANRTTLLELESQEARLKGQIGSTDSEIARLNQEIIRGTLEISNIKSSKLSEILKELRDTQAQVNEYYQRYYATKDVLERIIVRSPVDGIVNELYQYTIGGVIPSGGGNPIAEITPVNDTLVVDARIPRKNINSVQVGLKAKVRFGAFKSRTTPTFDGVVVSLSPDIIVDPRAGAGFENHMMAGDGAYYSAKIELDMKKFNIAAEKLHLTLHPGMQADIQIVTGTRTLIRYLFDPFIDNMFRAMREK